MKKEFRPKDSAFRNLWCGESDDTRIFKLNWRDLPIRAAKPKSKRKGEVAHLDDEEKGEHRWGKEKISIGNY